MYDMELNILPMVAPDKKDSMLREEIGLVTSVLFIPETVFTEGYIDNFLRLSVNSISQRVSSVQCHFHTLQGVEKQEVINFS